MALHTKYVEPNYLTVLQSYTVSQFVEWLEQSLDWYYAYSDDFGVWRRGEAQFEAVRTFLKDAPVEYQRVYNTAHKRRFDNEHFTSSEYPYEPPYPEAGYYGCAPY
jgi:hypothetical protein